jgi:hypothetical protein
MSQSFFTDIDPLSININNKQSQDTHKSCLTTLIIIIEDHNVQPFQLLLLAPMMFMPYSLLGTYIHTSVYPTRNNDGDDVDDDISPSFPAAHPMQRPSSLYQ